MTDSTPSRGPYDNRPHDYIYESGTTLYCAEVFSPEDAAAEAGFESLDECEVITQWHRYCFLTAEEKADPDVVFDIFMGDIDDAENPPDAVYWQVAEGTEDAVAYHRVKERERAR